MKLWGYIVFNWCYSKLSNIVHSHNLDSENKFNYDSRQSPELGNADTSSNDELIKQLRSEIDTLSNQLSDLNSNDISYKGTAEVSALDEKAMHTVHTLGGNQ